MRIMHIIASNGNLILTITIKGGGARFINGHLEHQIILKLNDDGI